MTYEVEWRDDYLGRAGREIRGKRNEVKLRRVKYTIWGERQLQYLEYLGKSKAMQSNWSEEKQTSPRRKKGQV
jgi:hypothetical protein